MDVFLRHGKAMPTPWDFPMAEEIALASMWLISDNICPLYWFFVITFQSQQGNSKGFTSAILASSSLWLGTISKAIAKSFSQRLPSLELYHWSQSIGLKRWINFHRLMMSVHRFLSILHRYLLSHFYCRSPCLDGFVDPQLRLILVRAYSKTVRS